MKDNDDVWVRIDRVISHLFRKGEINLATDLAYVRAEHMAALKSQQAFIKTIVDVYCSFKVSDTSKIHKDKRLDFLDAMEDMYLTLKDAKRED